LTRIPAPTSEKRIPRPIQRGIRRRKPRPFQCKRRIASSSSSACGFTFHRGAPCWNTSATSRKSATGTWICFCTKTRRPASVARSPC